MPAGGRAALEQAAPPSAVAAVGRLEVQAASDASARTAPRITGIGDGGDGADGRELERRIRSF
jgi:hypothetical protein